MNDRFDLSFKNKEVRVWIYINVPFITVLVFLMLFTEIPIILQVQFPLSLRQCILYGVFFIEENKRR